MIFSINRINISIIRTFSLVHIQRAKECHHLFFPQIHLEGWIKHIRPELHPVIILFLLFIARRIISKSEEVLEVTG